MATSTDRARHPTFIRVPGVNIAPEAVARDANPTAPNRLWIADLIAVHTSQGSLYLAAVLDCYTGRCLGYSFGGAAATELVLRALRMAATHRSEAPSIASHHDREHHETSLVLGRRCPRDGLAAPQGARASTRDLAVAESFSAMLRRDLPDADPAPTRAEASAAIVEWIEDYYNAETAPSPTAPWIGAQLEAVLGWAGLRVREESPGRRGLVEFVLVWSLAVAISAGFWLAVVLLLRAVL